jgi:hypothetical protein
MKRGQSFLQLTYRLAKCDLWINLVEYPSEFLTKHSNLCSQLRGSIQRIILHE